MKKSIPLMILILSVSLLAAQPESVQYISPLDQSALNSRAAEIIIRPGENLDPSSLSDALVSVVGEKSGEHSGRLVLSTDDKTIIFKPNRLYSPGEQVMVTLNNGLRYANGSSVQSFQISFTVTPLEKPLNPYAYKELGLVPHMENANMVNLGKTAAADTFPTDFPSFQVTINGEPSPGDIFFSPTHFISNDGYNLRISNTGDIKYYQKIENGVPYDFKVLANGMLSYGFMFEPDAWGASGLTDFFMMDSSYTIVDQFQMGNGYIADYHEFLYLPNGHVFMIAYDLQPVNMNGIVYNGHPGALVLGGVLQELDQNKNVIFQWRSWDHYKLTDSYNDLSQSVIDAIHLNAVTLDGDGHILLSALALGEVTKINRQTGNIIWRMGGKNNQFTFINESQEHAPLYFMFQHDLRRLSNGNITIFDNGETTRRKYSRVVEYAVDEVQKTVTKVWEYRKNPDVYAPNMGSAQRLPNGNTLICWGYAAMSGKPAITEVDPQGNIVFELEFDKLFTASYRAYKFVWDGGKPVADVLVPELQISNTYEFESGDQKTGLSIKILDKSSYGYNEAVAKLYNYAPLAPEFVAKAPMLEQSRIVLSEFNILNVRAELSFDVDFYELENPEAVLVYHREFEGRGLFLALPTVYNPATNKIVATMTKFGEFALAYPDHESQVFSPWLIEPYNGEVVDQTKPVHFEWTPVGYTTEYILQVAKDANFTNKVVDEQYITNAIYNMNAVETNMSYYWRVKSFNDIGESAWSPTYKFDTRAPYIKLKLPTGEAKWRRGLEYYVTWEDIIKEDVVLELYKNNTFVMVIDTVVNTGGYKWSIPLHLDAGTDYKLKIYSVDNAAVSDMSQNPFMISDTDTDVIEHDALPMQFALSQNFPNPFNPSTRISYQIPATDHVTLRVYDIRGSLVATLVDEMQTANYYSIDFNGRELSTGIYIYTLNVGNQFTETKKMLFVK
ncbi:aryl-sulfate sulfotransferase [candidate division KSB1 bacterium]|nr:aryl-sulfate sulfotransferase [candidate division KSB1 bacterium]